MTEVEILALAKQTEVWQRTNKDKEVIAFARLIEKQTREEDARICEGKYPEYSGIFRACFDTAEEFAEAIRSQK